MLRPNTRCRIGKRRRDKANGAGGNCGYEKMMKTLLLQNQQIIIQQQNMMFMVMKQFQNPSSNHQPSPILSQPQEATSSNNNNNNSSPATSNNNVPLTQSTPTATSLQDLHNQQQHQNNLHHMQQQQYHHPPAEDQLQQQQSHSNHHHHHHHQQQQHQLFSQASNSSQLATNNNNIVDSHHQLQQVANQLQENLGNYLTPAASEQDPINDKQEDDDLAALLDGDGLLHNNLLYNPQTDIGSITPYKNQQPQQQTPSYYSSGCESLTTPRVEQQRQPTNISQNVVKNLADSFKSPSKPKINVQILSGSATGTMKNSNAKIIQRMNISEFLRHVHSDNDEPQKNATQ